MSIAATLRPREPLPFIRVLGVRVHMVQRQDVVSLIECWLETEQQKCHWIVVTGMHGVMEAHKSPSFNRIVESADLFIPDGISLIRIARRRGFPLSKRTTGSDLIVDLCKVAVTKGYGNYFYGDTEETLEALVARLEGEFPGIKVAGRCSPPFRSLTREEDAEIVKRINEAKPDILWVGLGLPKQECWIFEHRGQLKVPVVIGVGAAFKFVSGKVRRAPVWVGDHGLEWLWRLLQEPRRLWRRVLIDGPRFVSLVALELSGLRRFD